MNQSAKRRNFEKKAYKRVNKIIDSINIMPFFANREFYDYSALEVMSLFSKIETALHEARDKYIYELQRESGEFIDIELDDDQDEDDVD